MAKPVQRPRNKYRGDLRSICLGCHTLLEGAEDWCPCVSAEDARMVTEVEKYMARRDNPPPDSGSDNLGFICFEGVLPPRASLKAISRLAF